MADSAVLLDTNVLLSATVPARSLHENALRALNEWPNQGIRLCTSGQILREYLVVATRPLELNGLGLTASDAAGNIDAFKARMRFLDETVAVFTELSELMKQVECSGKQFHDANVVATALAHSVARILTANTTDFDRFAPFVEMLSLAEV